MDANGCQANHGRYLSTEKISVSLVENCLAPEWRSKAPCRARVGRHPRMIYSEATVATAGHFRPAIVERCKEVHIVAVVSGACRCRFWAARPGDHIAETRADLVAERTVAQVCVETIYAVVCTRRAWCDEGDRVLTHAQVPRMRHEASQENNLRGLRCLGPCCSGQGFG